MILPTTAFPLLSHNRVSQITFHPTQPYLAIQSQERSVEIFRIRTEEEVRKKLARRKKRAKEKREREVQATDEANENETVEDEISLVDLFTPHVVVRASGKIRSFSFDPQDAGVKGGIQVCVSRVPSPPHLTSCLQILLALSNNALEVYNVPPTKKSKEEPLEASRIYSVDLPGHRADVRALCLSSDDQLLASASNGGYSVLRSDIC